MSAATPKGSVGDDLRLKFVFANKDGVRVVLGFHKSTLVAAVKNELLRNWPEGVEPPESTKSVRLICMGRGMLKDGQSLEQSNIPAFPTHPTPVNVSVLRKPTTVAAPEPARGAVQTAPKPVATAGCGCRIM